MDDCSCACSRNSCSPLLILTRVSIYGERSYIQEFKWSWTYLWVQLRFISSVLASMKEIPEQRLEDVFRQFERLVLFDFLELTHTCCQFARRGAPVYWDFEDDDEVDEVHEEEAELIAHLDELTSAAARRQGRDRADFTVSLARFIQQDIKNHPPEVLTQEEQQEMRNLGIIFRPQEPIKLYLDTLE